MNSIKQIVLASLLGALAACAQQPAYMATGDLGL